MVRTFSDPDLRNTKIRQFAHMWPTAAVTISRNPICFENKIFLTGTNPGSTPTESLNETKSFIKQQLKKLFAEPLKRSRLAKKTKLSLAAILWPGLRHPKPSFSPATGLPREVHQLSLAPQSDRRNSLFPIGLRMPRRQGTPSHHPGC